MKKPSVRQITALQYISQGMSKREAMLKAGYSLSSANEAKRIIATKSMKSLIETFQMKLATAGMTQDFMAQLLKDATEATKIITSHTEPDKEVPDHEIRLKAYDRWEKLMGLNKDSNDPQVKCRLTIEDFVNADSFNQTS